MAALIDEHTQFVSSSGAPINNGYIYVGSRNQDPVLNPITIYSDRALTTTLTNPQRTDANGRAVNKIWIPSRYSLKVEDENNVQQYQNLDLGEEPATGVTTLSNVQGINAITAEASPAISAYANQEIYLFTAASTNSGAVTLDAGGGVKDIRRRYNEALTAGDIVGGQVVLVTYNSASDDFEIVNPSRGNFRPDSGGSIASAAELPVNGAGNWFTVTGTTSITSFAAKGVGSVVILEFDGELVLTHNATDLLLPYGLNIGTLAGDVGVFQEYAAGDWRLISFSRPTLPTTVTSRAMSGEGVESDFTAIPSWVRSISIFLQDVSGTGTDNLELQLGDSGGIETSGYVGTFASVGTVIGNHSSAFALASTAAAGNVLTGVIRLEFAGPGAQGDVWVADWTISRTSTNNIYHGSGTFEFTSLGERLESLRLQWDGSATFDAGRVLLRYDA